jgi:hypothetical protein
LIFRERFKYVTGIFALNPDVSRLQQFRQIVKCGPERSRCEPHFAVTSRSRARLGKTRQMRYRRRKGRALVKGMEIISNREMNKISERLRRKSRKTPRLT